MRKPRLTHWDSNKRATILQTISQMHFFTMKMVARILNGISLNFNCRGHIGNELSLAQVVAWRQKSDKPLPEPMMTRSFDANGLVPSGNQDLARYTGAPQSIISTNDLTPIMKVPADILRYNDVVIASKRRHFDVITSKWRRFDVITTLILQHVFSGVTRHSISPRLAH